MRDHEFVVEHESRIRNTILVRLGGSCTEVAVRLDEAEFGESLELFTQRSVDGQACSLADTIKLGIARTDGAQQSRIDVWLPQTLFLGHCGLQEESHLTPW